jgi:hypothetical protein
LRNKIHDVLLLLVLQLEVITNRVEFVSAGIDMVLVHLVSGVSVGEDFNHLFNHGTSFLPLASSPAYVFLAEPRVFLQSEICQIIFVYFGVGTVIAESTGV